MTHIITIAGGKGGVAKTTTAVSLASGLANLAPTLLLDFDQQGQCSLFLGLPQRSGVYEWLVEGLPLADCLLTGRPTGLRLLPSDSLTKTVERLFSDQASFDRLVEMVKALPHDFVLIDTDAGGLLQEVALAASDQVIIPFECETPSLDRVYAVQELIRQLNPAADVTLLPVIFDRRLKEHRECLDQMVKEFGADYGLDATDGLYNADYIIPSRSAVKQCPSVGQTIWEIEAKGVVDVRRGYTVLANRVLRLAGLAAVQPVMADLGGDATV